MADRGASSILDEDEGARFDPLEAISDRFIVSPMRFSSEFRGRGSVPFGSFCFSDRTFCAYEISS